MNVLNDQTKISLVAGACLLGLVVALKNIVRVPAEVLGRDIVLYIIVYWTLGMYFAPRAAARRGRLDRPLVWAGLLVLMTAAIIFVYTLPW
jgi:hypothetical protein